MKRTVFKTAVFLLLSLAAMLSLSGCAQQSDEEFLAIAEAQLAKSAAVNAICFGEGILPVEEGGYLMSGYREASEASCRRYGVNTVADIKTLVSEVYSVATADYIDRVIFRPVSEDGSYLSYRRYADAMEGDKVHLMVKTGYEPLAVGDVTYTNLRLVKHDRKRAEVLVDITVSNGALSRTDFDVSLSLRCEEGVWRFDELTYASIK